jgi:hypothetical protein
MSKIKTQNQRVMKNASADESGIKGKSDKRHRDEGIGNNVLLSVESQMSGIPVRDDANNKKIVK